MATPLWAIAVCIGGTVVGSFGAIYLKKGSPKFNLNPFQQIKNKELILGCFLYGLATLIFIPTLKYGELSVLYPAVSTSYVFISILSVILLKEKMNTLKWTGIALIMLGVVFIGLAS